MDFKNMTPEVALQGFGSGFDCSTCTLAHVADKIGLDEETALKISGAFGGGMWRGDTCGAVVGALMAIGMKYAQTEAGDEETKNNMLEKKAWRPSWSRSCSLRSARTLSVTHARFWKRSWADLL